MNAESVPAGTVREASTGGADNLYAISPSSDPRSPFLVRDRLRHGRNDELRMMNVELVPTGVVRDARTGGAGSLYAASPSSDPTPSFFARDCSSLDDKFAEDLREFICHRLDRVDPFKESKEYRLQQEKASHLYEKLREMLPEAGQTMLREYSEALAGAHYLEVEILAERAFLDGAKLILMAVGVGCNDE